MKNSEVDTIFSKEDAAILEEVMNIAFGKASSDLARVIDIQIMLNAPQVEILKTEELMRWIKQDTESYKTLSMIEQNFWGKYAGTAILAFPSAASKKLISLFEDEDEPFEADNPLLERETLLEVGNILIGACVSKVAELLDDDQVSFSPPRLIPQVVVDNLSGANISPKFDDPDKMAILMKTIFHLQEKDVKGFLFMIASDDSMKWLKTALQNFMAKF
ncbi:MAG TPA: chemotaxis protein CheC [Desulfurivibrio alkaliphilus]|uniref:Chemotaxis protein CheC n=1 Tax=Desulfurivibrio alkaliphilus TaxID=427923 RepID=A0A7C2XLS7_9BACT|nr:chemotaxis protein CheC [Desulfurivibrio alkaliphilus]